MSSKFIKLVLFVCLWTSVLMASAQPGSNPGGGGKPGTVPITGIEILLAVGGLFGVRKFLANRRK